MIRTFYRYAAAFHSSSLQRIVRDILHGYIYVLYILVGSSSSNNIVFLGWMAHGTGLEYERFNIKPEAENVSEPVKSAYILRSYLL